MSKQSTAVVPEVIEENREVVPAESSVLDVYARGQFKDASEKDMAKEVSDLYKAVFDTAVKRAIRFGAAFYAVEFELGSRGKLKTGRGNADEGMLGWLKRNCPEVNYSTAMHWKSMAIQQANRLCERGVSPSDAIKMLQGKDEELEKKAPKKAVELRDEILSAPSIRKLTQGWFDFGDDGAGKRRPGRPKGSGAGAVEYKKKSALECAVEAVWPTVDHLLKHRGEMFTAYKILPDEKLAQFRDTLMEHVKAISAEIEGRGKR